jgi:hypothetical protein
MGKEPIIRADDNELLGYVAEVSGSWTAQTIFGYIFDRAATKAGAEKIVRERGLPILAERWQYYDKDERHWFPCRLKEVYEGRVIVTRTSELGYDDPDTYKVVIITAPDETNLIPA